uniref:Uncharacterized protein n=1 Tax=Glossina pallidipes TaxID=7398 RepID=A0A1B0A3L3_GLOPL
MKHSFAGFMRVNSAVLLHIFILTLLLGEVFSLHCHKCDSYHQRQCNNPLRSNKFLLKCPPKYRYCAISRLGNSTQRGCIPTALCASLSGELLDICCHCRKDGCNWGFGCTGHRVASYWFKILANFRLEPRYETYVDKHGGGFSCSLSHTITGYLTTSKSEKLKIIINFAHKLNATALIKENGPISVFRCYGALPSGGYSVTRSNCVGRDFGLYKRNVSKTDLEPFYASPVVKKILPD